MAMDGSYKSFMKSCICLWISSYMYGSPQNYNNSPTEHGLIENAKHPADHAQKSCTVCITSNKEINGNCIDQESKTVTATLL